MAVIYLQIKVKPQARKRALHTPGNDGLWRAELTAPPVDGKANAELIRLVATHFDCAQSKVVLVSGAGARIKRVEVTAP